MGCICVQDNIIKKKEKDNNDDKKRNKKDKKEKDKKKKSKNKEEKSEENEESENTEKNEEVIYSHKKEELEVKLESLYDSYYAAKEYFNKNELKEKEVEAIHCLKIIVSDLELIKQGKYKKIKISEIPEKISSKFITDYTPEERKEKIKEIILLLKKDKEAQKFLFDQKIIQMKKKLVSSKNLEKDKQEVKKILDSDQEKLKKIDKDIEKVAQTLVDDYIPVPLYRMIPSPYKKEKFNDKIKPNTMIIRINNLTYTKSNPIIILAIRGDEINIHKEINAKINTDLNEEFIWEFDAKSFKSLVKYNIEIALGRTYTIKSTKVKGKGELPLRKLKSQSSLEECIKLKMESGKPDNSINVQIDLRTPLVEKEYEDDFRDVVNIIKIYPKFVFS